VVDFPEITFAIGQAFRQLEADKVTPWVFLTAGKMRPIENFYGHTIQYSGVAFEGSPRYIFWNGFIEPFLEAIFLWGFNLALGYARERQVDSQQVIHHTKECLSEGISTIYRKMQDIDRRLRGKGFPDRVTPHNISGSIEAMQATLQKYYESALRPHSVAEKLKPPPLLDALEIKPSVFGVSLDLKKVWLWARGRLNVKSPTRKSNR
jgi:hypothetical protein